jgi:hypothetical protein
MSQRPIDTSLLEIPKIGRASANKALILVSFRLCQFAWLFTGELLNDIQRLRYVLIGR